MFGIGFGELIVIFIIALIVLGPKRLPEFARNVAKVYREVMGTINEVKSSVLDDGVKNIPNSYNHYSYTNKIEDNVNKENDMSGIEKGMKEYQNINLDEYEPKREKISFKKKNNDLEDRENAPQSKQS
ncbi:MAG: twin-arginine translocase subunit TatB [Persephonella sp.]|nr:MAG: twin-arginine translocase subunit TatB [Persephonella sp.]